MFFHNLEKLCHRKVVPVGLRQCEASLWDEDKSNDITINIYKTIFTLIYV